MGWGVQLFWPGEMLPVVRPWLGFGDFHFFLLKKEGTRRFCLFNPGTREFGDICLSSCIHAALGSGWSLMRTAILLASPAFSSAA